MSNNLYKNLIIKRINSFIELSKTVDLVNHLGLRGKIRESGLGHLLVDLLPSDWAIGSGKIVDSQNIQSAETDLIIFYTKLFPPIFLFEGKGGIFPFECCGFVFEVKTKSTSKEMKTTIKKFQQLQKMKVTEDLWEEKIPLPGNIELKPIKVYFALDTDVKSETEFERYKKHDKSYLNNPAVQIICIVGKGIWYFRKFKDSRRYDDDEEIKGYWVFYKSGENYIELRRLFCFIVNQLVSLTNESLDIRKYWLDEKEIEEYPESLY